MIATAERLNSVQEYYFSKKLREVNQMLSEGKPIINMGIGSPDLLPHFSVVNAIQNSMNDKKAHEYQSYQGLPELRKAMTTFYQNQFNVSMDFASEVLPLMGSKEGIMHVSMAFLNKSDEVLIPNPGYPTYASVTELVQAKPIFYDLVEENNWLPDFEALEKLDLSKVKIMWVCYPHMPTGANATMEVFEKLIAFGKKHHILIVNDNPYSFVLNRNPMSIFQVEGAKEIALELNSLSKSFNMSGWRVGMILGNKTFLEAVLKVKSNMDSGMFYGIQKGAIEALSLDKNWFESQNEVYSKRRNLLFELVEKLSCSYNKTSVGLFIWAKLPKNVISSETFIDTILIDKNIFITPGTIFGSNGEGYIRFSLCIEEEKIKEALARF
ncbi:MAG TPA: aminotransferase class I/II-fold pyridoxal phosphate-dependent enzyme [Flavobacterium sp.]|uniref:pyridoxal phosphate-dependent aminotransferase n=1 Tax=unclassified Flavobacterium TaxID=196869 RepID=UPI000E919FE2|nr:MULTISPECIES: aminotransferase class I/II-fold pyridoxal phosphate-dependent enzyme [unclassified Flavobacterium]HBI02033.1 aminotransferase [Flavobacterium sp.]HRE77406.1 aminotransferase class I/II-fold pyridoxal phosphate-dependent enzyme [Flavobacterium sp.]